MTFLIKTTVKEKAKYLTNNNRPREKMILFLLELGCEKIVSYTDSTIHFRLEVKKLREGWEQLYKDIVKEFPKLYFSINLIPQLGEKDKLPLNCSKMRYEKDSEKKIGFKTNFDNDVNTIKKKLKEESSTKK